MNAIEFIQQHGVDKAREVVECAPERATHLFNGEYVRVSDPRWILDGYVSIADLKRLVESVELVNHMGGIAEIKRKFRDNGSLHGNRLKQAIADYEQLFGNTETLELETLRDCDTSPNCKKFDERVK